MSDPATNSGGKKPTPYSTAFFEGQMEGSARSAAVVLPIVFELVRPSSVADVGCGVGAWLGACVNAGIADVRGFDGDYVDRRMLRFPERLFTAVDLTKGFKPDRAFDLALCLEVGEHLPEGSAAGLVETLCACAPAVLFSAAVPLQGGTGHVNEKPQSWWAEQFAARGYAPVDCVRHLVWNDDRVAWWYRQNMLLYVRRDRLAAFEALQEAHARTNAGMLDVVHPRLLAKRNEKPLRRFARGGAWLRAIRGVFTKG